MKENKGLLKNNLLLLLLVVVIAVLPLILVQNAEFGGADGEAEGIILAINPDYEPWFHSIIEPASGEIESLLFALQAVLGSAVIFYYIGYVTGKKKGMEQAS
ncbi:MAG: energy-coupling factor ABC transporter substrate-binding protein [Clostridia bacterium]